MYVLVFDSDCVNCSKVATKVRSLGIEDLQVAGLRDPKLFAAVQASGKALSGRPTLVELHEDRVMAMWTGWSMRARLARLIGAKRARDLIGLAVAESRAHASRRRMVAGERDAVARRRLLGGLAGASAGAVLAAATPAAAAGTQSSPGATLADSATRDRALATTALQQARKTWGVIPDNGVYVVTGADGLRYIMALHQGGKAVTTYEDTASEPDVALTLTFDQASQALQYHFASGQPLAEVSTQGSQVQVRPLHRGGQMQPDGVKEFTGCFVSCLGAHVSPECVLSCIGCVTGGINALLECPVCLECAGTKAISCARHCKNFL